MGYQYHQFNDAKLLYQEHYCDAYDYAITCLKGRFDKHAFT